MSAATVEIRGAGAEQSAPPVASIYRQPKVDAFRGGVGTMPDVRRNAAGNPVKSVEHTVSGMASILRSIPNRVDLDEVDLPDLAALNELHASIDHALAECVRRMRAQRDEYGRPWASWAQIGRALGITRQAAQQRFGEGP